MLNGMIIFIVIILFFAFFIIHKRDMLIKMFSLNASMPAGEFQAQLEKTADAAIKRLETQIAHLELLLEEADAKINQLDEKLKAIHALPVTRDSLAVQPQESVVGNVSISPVTPMTSTPITSVDFRLPAEIPEPVIALPEPAPTNDHPPQKEMPEGPTLEKRRLILNMAEEGYSVIEIAKTTGMGKGEIMLVLQLNKK